MKPIISSGSRPSRRSPGSCSPRRRSRSSRRRRAVAAARELVELKGGAQMFDPIIVGVVEQTKVALLQTNPQLSQGPERRQRAVAHRIRAAPRRAGDRGREILRPALHRAGAQGASSTFYKSPLGRKMVAQEPQVLDETFNYVRAVGAARRRGGDEPLPRRDEEEGAQSLGRAALASMADFDTDLFVIGGGSGGVRAARIAAGYGARVMLAEEYRVGGTCVIRGCVPKKLLVYASRFAHEFEDAAGYGWTVARAVVRLADADRQQGQGDRAARGRLYGEPDARQRDDREDPRGAGRRAHGAPARGRPARARQAHPDRDRRAGPAWAPASPGIEHVISSNEAFHLTELPQRILIQGGGYIAVEFACIFAGLGSQVTLVYRGENILRGFDDDVRAHLRDEMERRGIKVICKRIVEAVEKVDHGLCVRTVRPRRHRGRQGDVRDRAAAERVGARPRGGRRAHQRQGRDRGRRVLAHLGAAHLCGRRRHRPARAHAGRDPRGPRLRRHGVRRQADRGRSRQRADRGVLRSPRSASSG